MAIPLIRPDRGRTRALPRTQLGEALRVKKVRRNEGGDPRARGNEGKPPPSSLAYAPDLERYHRTM